MHIRMTGACENNARGSVTVEAALFLPVFIISIITLAYLIKIMYIQEMIFHGMNDRIRVIAAEAYAADIAGVTGAIPVEATNALPLDLLGLQSDLLASLKQDRAGIVNNLRMEECRYLFSEGGRSSQIQLRIGYDIQMKLPIELYGSVHIENQIRARAWTGKIEQGIPMQFAEMAKAASCEIVYVFPRAGEKYHNKDCQFIRADPEEVLLTFDIRKKFRPCRLCGSGNLTDGSLVYCFSDSGEAYHAGTCPLVSRYIITMDKKHAEEEGYKPCSKCEENQ